MTIIQAIRAFLAADSTIMAAIPGGIHTDSRPERGVWPYLVVSCPADPVISRDSRGTFISEPVVSFAVYVQEPPGESGAVQLGTMIHDRLAGQKNLIFPDRSSVLLSLMPHAFVTEHREGPADKGPQAGAVWSAQFALRARIQRQLPPSGS